MVFSPPSLLNFCRVYFRDNLFQLPTFLIVLDPKHPFVPGHPSNTSLCYSLPTQKVAKSDAFSGDTLRHDLTLSPWSLAISPLLRYFLVTLRSKIDTDIKQNVQPLVRLLDPFIVYFVCVQVDNIHLQNRVTSPPFPPIHFRCISAPAPRP